MRELIETYLYILTGGPSDIATTRIGTRANPDILTDLHWDQAQHAVWMLNEMRDMDYASDKFMRRLGFVQGVLWCNGDRTINQLREDVINAGK